MTARRMASLVPYTLTYSKLFHARRVALGFARDRSQCFMTHALIASSENESFQKQNIILRKLICRCISGAVHMHIWFRVVTHVGTCHLTFVT